MDSPRFWLQTSLVHPFTSVHTGRFARATGMGSAAHIGASNTILKALSSMTKKGL